MWERAITNLSSLPTTMSSTPKSLCVLVTPNDMRIQTIRNYSGGDTKTVINRLKTGISRKPFGRKRRTDRTGPSCTCPDCGKSFISPHFLSLHLMNSGQKEACVLCGDVVSRGRQMKQHMSTAHRTELHLCTECPLLFPTGDDLKNHTKLCHKPGSFTCGECGRSFPRKGAFDHHTQMHTVRTCRSCGAQFTNRGCYREHRIQCEPDAKPSVESVPRARRSNIRDPATYTCDYCAKTYNSRPQLKNHILWIHMDVRPHQCQWCGKRFYTPARLAEHTVVHTRVRNFECDICGAKLVSKMAAIYHKRRHTGERPYKCQDCGEGFISSSRRTEHAKRKHNKGPKLQCIYCPASFVRKQELLNHREKMHMPEMVFENVDGIEIKKSKSPRTY